MHFLGISFRAKFRVLTGEIKKEPLEFQMPNGSLRHQHQRANKAYGLLQKSIDDQAKTKYEWIGAQKK